MKLTGLHLLLTYQCTLECEHCFVWGSPWQTGALALEQLDEILRQAKEAGTVESIYFEGGEPFLYYPILARGVQEAARLNFKVGIVSNAYWATTVADALEWLKPFAGLVDDLSVSTDAYHWSERSGARAENARAAAEKLGIPLGTLTIAQPEAVDAASTTGQLPPGECGVMYRGRAAEKLIARAGRRPWEQFAECPHEELREPGRIHVDPFGNLHLCQGLVIGNLFRTPLREICETYDPDRHPIAGALLAGGPAELVRRFGLSPAPGYVDACHLCYTARLALRARFPEILAPDQLYGVTEE